MGAKASSFMCTASSSNGRLPSFSPGARQNHWFDDQQCLTVLTEIGLHAKQCGRPAD